MKVLIIDNTIDPISWGSYELVKYGKLAPGATLHVRRAPHDDLPESPAGWDRIIVSGSRTSAMEDAPWIERLLEFIRRAVDMKKPYLGVCYGHQSLVRALGGKERVRLADRNEHGWSKIRLLEDSALTQGLSQEFYSYSSHYDEVSSLPQGMRKLASSEDCEIQACQLDKLPIFGIQFHPEKTAEDAKKSLGEHKKNGKPKYLLHPNDTDKLYRPEIGETIFGNFFKL
ncbi:MAG: type 1 glutamine amidotransferase [Bdellovibrionia bacterium]